MADHVDGSIEGVARLQAQAECLTDASISILAQIVGGGNVTQFRHALASLTPRTLAQMRETLGNMGLGHGHVPIV